MRAVNILLALLMSAVLAGLVLEGGLRLVGFAPAPSLHVPAFLPVDSTHPLTHVPPHRHS